MQNTLKYLPSALSVVLAVLLGLSWFSSKTAIEKKDAEIAVLQQQSQQLANEVNNKVSEIAVLQQQSQQLANEVNNKVAEANHKIELANQPEVPVRVSFRKALMSSGNVAGFSNFSNQAIAVAINVNRASSQSRNFEMTLDPGAAKEIGEREGWAFIPGDTITVTQAGHKSLTFQAP